MYRLVRDATGRFISWFGAESGILRNGSRVGRSGHGATDLLSGGTDGQASYLPRLVRKAGEAASVADTRSRRRRARRTVDNVLQSWDHHAGTTPRAGP